MRQPVAPQEPDYPEPRCEVCRSYEVTEESTENGTPLCEDHDTDVARQRFHLELGIDVKGEDLAHISMKMDPSNDELERLQARHSEVGSELSSLRQELRDLQERCDHENADRSSQTYTEEDLLSVPDDEMPDELPVEVSTIICWECGLQSQESDW